MPTAIQREPARPKARSMTAEAGVVVAARPSGPRTETETQLTAR